MFIKYFSETGFARSASASLLSEYIASNMPNGKQFSQQHNKQDLTFELRLCDMVKMNDILAFSPELSDRFSLGFRHEQPNLGKFFPAPTANRYSAQHLLKIHLHLKTTQRSKILRSQLLHRVYRGAMFHNAFVRVCRTLPYLLVPILCIGSLMTAGCSRPGNSDSTYMAGTTATPLSELYAEEVAALVEAGIQ